MRARGRGRAAPTGGRGRGRGGAHRGRGRPRSLLSLPRAQASWAPQLPAGLTGPPVPCLPSQGEAPAEMGALLLEKEPRGAAERGECGPGRPDRTSTLPTPNTGSGQPGALNFFFSPPRQFMALWGTPLIVRRPFPRPTRTPWSLPAPPLRPLSLSPSAMRGLTPLSGPHRSSGRNPRTWREMGVESCWVRGWGARERGCKGGFLHFCLPCTPPPPSACLFSRPCHKVIPLFPQQGGCLSQSGQNVNDRGRKVAPLGPEFGHEAVEHAWGPGSCNCWA